MNPETTYYFTIVAYDEVGNELDNTEGEFVTLDETVTGLDNTPFPSGEGRGEALKLLRNGQIFILRGEKVYTITGQAVR